MHGPRLVAAGVVLVALGACSAEKVEPLSPPGTSTLPSDPAPVSSFTPSPDPTLAPVGPAAAWTQPFDVRRAVVATGDVVVFHEFGKSVHALRRADGKSVWNRPLPTGAKLLSLTLTAGGVAVKADRGNFQESLEILDPASGRVRWSTPTVAGAVVYQDAVYVDTCAKASKPCTITSRDVRTGKVRWTIPWRGAGGITEDAIGIRWGQAPVAGKYVAVHWGTPDTDAHGDYRVLETATGKAMAARLPSAGWIDLAVGNLLVSTDQDGIAGCGVRIRAADVRTGKTRQLAELQSAKKADDECSNFLANYGQGQVLLGAGSRIVAVTGDRPVLYDIAAAKVVWTAPKAGVPVDSDGKSLLVRAALDKGGLAMLDLANGRTRWTAPDPGATDGWPGMSSAVTGRLVAVEGYAERQRVVFVYDAATGKQLGRYAGGLVGTGEDWVTVVHDGALSLIPF